MFPQLWKFFSILKTFSQFFYSFYVDSEKFFLILKKKIPILKK